MNFYAKKSKDYKLVQIKTAPPEKLLIMCYDGLLKFLKTAKLLTEKGQADKSSVYILKATNVIVELIASLKPEESPEFAENLKNLYIYLIERLRESLEKGTVDGIDYVIDVIASLKDTWEEALSKKQNLGINARAV